MKRVLIVHRIIAPYRIPFYNRLRDCLKQSSIDLTVIHGQPTENELEPYADLDFAIKVKAKYIHLGRRFFVWLPVLKYVKAADLVIVQQANKNLLNYLLVMLRKPLRFKLAFWGHGRGFQLTNHNSFSERLKKLYSAHVDHWFAYTDRSKQVVSAFGFPEKRITAVNNAIDTTAGARVYDEIEQAEIDDLRRLYSIAEDAPVGIFCSRLYPGKRPDFLVQCATKVREQIPYFHLFIIGNGPQSSFVQQYANIHSNWFHYLGPMNGREKIKLFKLAHFQLIPGSVGLNVVESFALLTPLITTNIDTHGPEIVYLQNGINGIITDNTQQAYIDQIIRLSCDKDYHCKLVDGCRKARRKYTIENMVSRFAEGITKALT